MAKISEAQAFALFQQRGRNSSHFVWFLTPLEFFETGGGWVFAYLRRGRVTIFALEPLMPEGPLTPGDFDQAWQEVETTLEPGISLFVSVYDDFLADLMRHHFQSLHVGKEPYVQLANCIPTGKTGKGVRAARNQALRAGIQVAALGAAEIEADPVLQRNMAIVLRRWKERKLLDLGGFLNTVQPFQHMQIRRYFVATNVSGQLEGFLVATPIPGRRSYFLEDLVLRPGVARGVGELLTLEAMATLAETSAEYASLGVVSLTSMSQKSAHGLPPAANFALVTLPKFLSRFYNVGGLETFRKRFKPHRWENIHLALRNHPRSKVGDSRAWLMAVCGMFSCFRPKLNLSWRLPVEALRHEVSRHPVSTAVCSISTLSFILVNHGGQIPRWTLLNFGFSGDSPYWQWPYRTLTSDFLFFDFAHYASSVVLLFVLVRWMERTYPVRFVATVIFVTAFLDDFVNQLVLIAPYSYFRPTLFEHLLSIKDVGPSLWVALVLGVQLCTLKKYREIAFSIVSVAIVLAFAFSAAHLSTLILNLNHSLFFAVGFILGKLRFEYERSVSRKVARQKPPTGKSVAVAGDRRRGDSGDRRRSGTAAPAKDEAPPGEDS